MIDQHTRQALINLCIIIISVLALSLAFMIGRWTAPPRRYIEISIPTADAVTIGQPPDGEGLAVYWAGDLMSIWRPKGSNEVYKLLETIHTNPEDPHRWLTARTSPSATQRPPNTDPNDLLLR